MAEGPYIGRQAAQSITGGAYGEGTELDQIQTQVPLAATETSAAATSMGSVSGGVMPTRNFATPNPNVDQEITFGAGFGAGPGNDDAGDSGFVTGSTSETHAQRIFFVDSEPCSLECNVCATKCLDFNHIQQSRTSCCCWRCK
jgi:hypothetical protein